jgi:trimeric autotransporter adhesin
LVAVTTGTSNSSIGNAAGADTTTGSNNTFLGSQSGRAASPFQVTTQSNRIVLGDNAITNIYAQVSVTAVSDARDKMNITPVPHGLCFVKQLNPVSFQFKKSRDREIPHGNKRYGFLAQDIIALEGENPVIIDNEQPEKLKLQGDALIPVLVNAIKELTEKVESLESK